MIIYLYGQDSYRRQQRLNYHISRYKDKYQERMDILIADLEENPDDWLKIKDFINQPSMFTESKTAVIKEVGTVQNKEWITLLKNQLETKKTFIIISDSQKPLKSFDFLLAPPAKQEFFEELSGKYLEIFIKKEAQKMNLTFTPEAWRFLLNYINTQDDKSWLAIKEMEKIALADFKQPVSINDLKKIIFWFLKDEISVSCRRILSAKNVSERMIILEKLFIQKEDAGHIFNSLAYQVFGKKALTLADYDITVKSGKLGYEEAVVSFSLDV